MLSSLSRGYGSWTGDVDVRVPPPQDTCLPSVDLAHRHGVTVTPRSKGAPVIVPVAEDGQLNIPKTFATRKGALMLFTAPDAMPEGVERPRRPIKRKRRDKDVLDLSLKLKTLERLSLSVLQFGDKLYDKDTSSISDKENKLMLNFLHDLNEEHDDTDLHSQPGGDYKFYLRDLKRRASCRGHGVGDTTPQRARSTELQEILDDLEATWPKYSQSYRKDSSFTGSVASGDNFLYPPESPAPSMLSTRSNTRGKILSCKKLTASLKSLTSMGRPTSTEPDTRSIVSDSFMASTQYRFGDPRRSKSSVWVSEASSPAYFTQSRPLTSHKRSQSAMAQRTSEHKLMTSPEPSEVGAPVVTKSQNMWVEVDNQADTSYISDDGHSLLSGADSDFRASDRGQAMTPVKEERMSTPSKGGDRDAMLAEAASVLSSLVEEEDIDLPDGRGVAIKSQPETPMVAIGPDNFFISARHDITFDDTDASRLAGLTETEDQSDADGLRSRMSSRSKTPKLKSELGEDVDLNHVAQPLQPPYSGPMTRENRSTSPMEVVGEEMYKATQEDASLYPASRTASAEPGSEDAQILFSSGRGDSVTSRVTTPAPRMDTPTALSVHSEGLIQEVSQMLSDAEQMRASSVLGSASVSSTDKHAQDPDTLVSVFGRQDTGDFTDKPQSPSASQVMKSSSPLPPSSSLMAENVTVPVGPPATMATTTSLEMPKAPAPEEQPTELPVTEVTEEMEEDYVVPEPLAPKRRERTEESKASKSEGEAEEGEVVDGEEAKEEVVEESTELSERVKKEMEEREQRLIKQKEEKEAEEARIKDEEEMKKQAAEDKRKAAEERIRLKAEELARKKEEERLLQEQMPSVPEEEPKKGAKAKKGKAKGSKQEPATEEKKYVNALDITSLQTGDGSKEGSAMDILDKLKSSNKDVDLPVEKIQAFMKAQTPKVKQEPEKEEVHVPEHMKEMFNRRTESQAQEELEQGIAKMRNAVNDALGGSLLQEDSVEGLSAEEFEAAQEALKEKLKQAEEQMLEAVTSSAGAAKKSGTPRVRKQEKKGSPTRKKKGTPDQTSKSDLVKEREVKKEQQRLEKQKRLEEVKELQQKINMKEEERKAKEREARRKAEELKEHMESIKREEEELERAEQDAREQLAAVRKAQREERETRRKADLERKKQEAINRREKEKAMIEQAREKEQEMLDRIADAEMARRLREEEEAKREEEEQAAQERYEAEMKEAQRLAEEEEERLRELERQAEEEAFQRLMEEKEAAEEKRLQLEREAARMREEEKKQNLAMLEEEKRLEAERRKHEEEEEMRREQERERLRELQRLEEEARDKMRAELEKRRQWAMKRREYNLEQRANLDAIRQCQGVTDSWTFSYFVRWPKESYHRPMGQDPKKKPGAPRPKPKPSTQQGSTNTQSAVDVAAVP